jgi:serine protease AprX
METLSTTQIEATLSPNPCKEFTRISYTLIESGKVTIQVLDIQGRLIKSVVSGQYQVSGTHELVFSTLDDLSPGSYLVKIQTEKGSNSMMLIQQ